MKVETEQYYTVERYKKLRWRMCLTSEFMGHIMTVTFCGHSEVNNYDDVKAWLYEKVENLIELGADMFLLGGYGMFDRMASAVVWDLKKKYPEVQSVLVKAYIDRKMDESECDWTVYPSLENVPQRLAILHCNRYMVDKADYVVVYVTHGWGGAAQTLEYTNRKKKSIICYK